MTLNLERSLELSATLTTFMVLAVGLILGEGSLREKLFRSRSIAARWVVYSILDYGLMALSIGLVAASRAFGVPFGGATLAMFIFDLVASALLWWLCLKSGQDLTLGREYRRSTTLLFSRSRWAGALAFGLLVAKCIIWDGPERLLEYFHPELEGRKPLVAALLPGMALAQALFWTGLYWIGLDAISK